MVDNFKDMLLSVDGGDITLALDILNNRDTTNKESEENYNEILTLIFKDNILFPNKPVYVIKIDLFYILFIDFLNINFKIKPYNKSLNLIIIKIIKVNLVLTRISHKY
jgi:hypothetical protein